MLAVRVSNTGTESVYLKDLILFTAHTDAELAGQKTNLDLSLGETYFMDEAVDSQIDAHPIFIGDSLFCGIDWPVAENAVQGSRLMCRQFCGDMLKPGETFTSRNFTIGACKKGEIARAFLEHLQRVRGRKTVKASMYFTWLMHTWDGRYLAFVARLPEGVKVPLMQEVAIAWVEDDKGHVWPVTEASPIYPFNGWENNTYHEGSAWTFRLPVTQDMTGKKLTMKLVWYGPAFAAKSEVTDLEPMVEGRLVAAR